METNPAAFLEAVCAASPIGIGVLDRQCRYVYVNPRLATLNRVPVDAHRGRSVRDVIPALAHELEPVLQRVMITGGPVVDLERRDVDPLRPGELRDWRIAFLPVWDRNAIVGVGGVILDVTREKAAERARMELNDQLQRLQRLESLGRLAGGIAHDFNNLLTTIGGYADVILEQPNRDATLRADVEQIRKAASVGAGLTKQLLAFSRRQPVEPQLLNVNDVVTDLEAVLRRLVGDHVSLVTALDRNLAPVFADAARLEQVLMNLVVNARDAMPRGGALTITTESAMVDEVFVAAHPGATTGRHVRLTVRDTGVGMDRSVQARLFEPFFTTKAPGRGTGLGLTVVKAIIEQMAGVIAVSSEPGQGTAVKILLPAAQ